MNDETKNYRKQVIQLKEQIALVNEHYIELVKKERDRRSEIEKNTMFLKQFDQMMHNILSKLSEKERQKLFTDKEIIGEFSNIRKFKD